MYIQNTTTPYYTIPHTEIQYCTCRDYSHISRYSCLRQVAHNLDSPNRFVALETVNPFTSSCPVRYHTVTADEEDRLDLLAHTYLGSATYAWVIAQFNNLPDGFTIHEGQKLAIPYNVSALMSSGEILAPVPAMKLNLSSE